MKNGKKHLPATSSSMGQDSREQTFKESFEKHSDELFRHCYLRLSDRERALELTQETFLRAWDYVVRGETIEHYRSFLYRILNNLIIDEYRKKKTQSLDALLEDEESALSLEGEVLRDSHDILEESMVRFDAKKAMGALQGLPSQYQTVLVMRYIDGLSPTEIAGQMQETENAISVRIHRGLKKLRDALSAQHIEL